MRVWRLACVCALAFSACLLPKYSVVEDGGPSGAAGTSGTAGTNGGGGRGGVGGSATGRAGAAGTGTSGTAGGGRGGGAGVIGATGGAGGTSAGVGGTAGGSAGRGGTIGAAGTGGGAAGRGGTTGAAGTGTGGGVAGRGGTTGAAGSAGRGGTTGAGGAAGMAGTAGGTVIARWTFNASGDGDFNSIGVSAPGATTVWANDGYPQSGSFEVFASLSATEAQAVIGPSYNADLRGVILTAYVKLVSGFSPTFPGHAFAYAQSGVNDVFASGPPVTLIDGTWVLVTMTMSQPYYAEVNFSPAEIVGIGVTIEAPAQHETAATVRVDTITLTAAP